MKKLIFIACLTGLILGTPCLSSCNSSWNYSKEDPDFYQYYGDLVQNDDLSLTFSVDTGFPILKDWNNLDNKKDYVLYNATKLANDDSIIHNKDVFNFNDFTKYEVPIQKFDIGQNGCVFTVKFDGEPSDDYSLLFNKNVSIFDNFVMFSSYPMVETTNEKEFQKKYLAMPGPEYIDEQSKKIDVIDYFGKIMELKAEDNLNEENLGSFLWALFKGIFNLVTSMISYFTSASDSVNIRIFQNIHGLLASIDSKLNTLSAQVQQKLIEIQCQLDQQTIYLMEQNINGFIENHKNKMDNYKRGLSADYMPMAFPDYVKNTQSVKIVYAKNPDDGSFYPLSYKSTYTGETVDVNVSNMEFVNTRNYIQKSGVSGGNIINELLKDIDVAIQNVSLPAGVQKEDFKQAVLSNIEERIFENIYKSANMGASKVTDIRDEAINYCRAIPDLVSSMTRRFSLLYNFAGEGIDDITTTYASLLHDLDLNTAFAQLVIRSADANEAELSEAYKSARETIINSYNQFKNLKSGHSFTVGKELTSNFIYISISTKEQGKQEQHRFNPSIYPAKFHMNTDRGHPEPDFMPLNDFHALESTDILKLSIRFNALKQVGLIDYKLTFIDYLAKVGIISSEQISYKNYYETKYQRKDTYKVIASDITTRALTSDDRGRKLTCEASHYARQPYFKIGQTYGYMETRREDCWSGKVYLGKTFNGTTGAITNNAEMILWAEYYESRKGWPNVEHHAFLDPNLTQNPGFFLIPKD